MFAQNNYIFLTVIVWSIAFNFISGANVSARFRYFGCYEDEHMGNIHLFDKKLSLAEPVSFDDPIKCIEECTANKYSYAGVNDKECYCNNDFPSEIVKTSDQECESSWFLKHSSAKKDSSSRLAVYETGVAVPDPKPARVYIGCYNELNNKEHRLFKGSYNVLKNNTPDVCHKLCLKGGFRYFALTYREECFCGDARPSEDILTDESDCGMSCPGNPATFCGGGWMLSAYATGLTDVPADNRFVGCYKNSEGDKSFNESVSVALKRTSSPRRCLSICDQRGFKYAGLQNRERCYCGDQLPQDGFLDNNRFCINLKCSGDTTQTCGSRSHLKLYRTRKAENTDVAPSEYMGCYNDQAENPIMRESKELRPQTLTTQLCTDICQQRGFPFAGLKFGRYCLCDHHFPSLYSKTSDDYCKTKCPGNSDEYCGGTSQLGVYYTGLPRNGAIPSSIYSGCYRDDDKNNRLLKGTWQEIEGNTPQICQNLCYTTGYSFFGLTWFKECFCGNESPPEELLLDEVECNTPCDGDSNVKCGGGWRTSIYRTGLTDSNMNDKYIGCYNDRSQTALLTDYSLSLSRTNTPKVCWNICNQLAYLFAGVERGIDCHCGNQAPDDSLKDSDEACNMKCPGDEHEFCGKQNKIRVFRTSIPDSIENLDAIFFIDIRSKGLCNNTATIKNGTPVCSKEVIFKELFKSLDTTVWKPKVQIASEPHYEFVTYMSSNEIIFEEKGVLHIRPQIKDEDYVLGNLKLANCTGVVGSQQCEKLSQSFLVIPPIISGSVNTKDVFTFRYGSVQIKAKLPLGDWIVPDIALLPKDNTFNEDISSAEIRFAMARGNKELTCDNTELGNTRLEAGIYVTFPTGTKSLIFAKYIRDSRWSYSYHNYTVLWTPNGITFFVDNEILGTIQPTDKSIIQLLNPNAEEPKSKMAPFDREFYISLGVSAGGFRDFPDSCISNGKKKPWSNQSPKATLNFWQAHNDWMKTWETNKSLLQVEHVRVLSL